MEMWRSGVVKKSKKKKVGERFWGRKKQEKGVGGLGGYSQEDGDGEFDEAGNEKCDRLKRKLRLNILKWVYLYNHVGFKFVYII